MPDDQQADQQMPDQQEPDQQEPDQQEPDQQEPDQQEPDQQEPDQQEPDQQEPGVNFINILHKIFLYKRLFSMYMLEKAAESRRLYKKFARSTLMILITEPDHQQMPDDQQADQQMPDDQQADQQMPDQQEPGVNFINILRTNFFLCN